MWKSARLRFADGHAPGAPASVHHLGRGGKTAELHHQAAQPGALLEIHIDELESHSLRPRTAHNRMGPDVAYTVRDFQNQQRARSQVSLTGTYAPAQIQLWNGQAEVFAHVLRDRNHVARELHPRIAPLANHVNVRIRISRL